MGFMDELKKLTQPYDDEDDFFEGADPAYKPQPKAQTPAQQPGQAQALFESTFAGDQAGYAEPQQQRQPQQQPRQQAAKPKGGFFQKQPFAKQAAPQQPQMHQTQQAAPQQPDGSLFGNLGKPKQPKREGRVNFGGREAQVILFSPRTFDEAGDIVNHIRQNRSVVMTLEGLPSDTARRLLDFISGIAYALGGKITPVSAKTYFVTPQNVDILGAQPDQPESDGQYF